MATQVGFGRRLNGLEDAGDEEPVGEDHAHS